MSEKQTEIDYSLIVKRIPVIINKPVKKSICLLKFHLRNNDRPYLSEKNIFKLESVKIKKKSLKLEICLNTNTEIQHFNPENSFPRDKLILVSRNIPNRPNYALFNVINGKMVLTPVKHIFMMSPDFSYINELAKNEKLEKSAKSNKKSEENLKMITIVQKLRRDNKTSNMAKFVAFKDNLNASQQEKFVTLTETKPNLINQLLEKESFAIQKMVKNSNFVDIIRNESNKKKNIVPKNPNFVRKNLSKFYIQSNALNLENKIIAILKNRGTSTLMEISKILKIEENDEKKVKQLQSLLFKNAFYLHGVWVARSKLIYGDIQKRCRFARDLLIAMFGYSPDGSIYKSNWDLVANLKDDKSLAILSEISKFDSLNKKWTLKNLGGFIDFEFVEQQKYLLSKLYVISKRVLAGKGSENDELDLHFADFLSAEFKSAQNEALNFLKTNFDINGVCSLNMLEKRFEAEIRKLGTLSNLAILSKNDFWQLLKFAAIEIKPRVFILGKTKGGLHDKTRIAVATILAQTETALSKEDIALRTKKELDKTELPASFGKILSELGRLSANKKFKLKKSPNF